ncbi:MAG: BNR-4 repeat-containing protein [Bacteroidales bacterium]|nr:BNR-4 repeat-containing protein [Bacteroidales bacterium]
MRFTYLALFFLISFSAIKTGFGQNNPPSGENVHPDARFSEAVEMNIKANGFRGIWYMNQPSNDEYVYKYSGGMATYTAKHQPIGIYSKKAKKTFFCFGGTDEQNSTLFHNISYFNHKSGKLANPTTVLDKRTNDAHDNPVISLDEKGFIWMFSTSHGATRPSYIYKSSKPYYIDHFEKVDATEIVDGQKKPFDNFSYFQVWYVKSKGFFAVYSKYQGWNNRIIGYNTSRDGVNWNEWKVLAHIEEGHYAISGAHKGKIAVAFNYHPKMANGEQGLNHRTNLYYLETSDFGESWQSIDGQVLSIPVKSAANAALVKDLKNEGRLCYLKDLNFDRKGNPVILVVTSNGYQPGPGNDPRTWEVFSYLKGWNNSKVTSSSDNNYDTGSLFIEKNNSWVIIGPTQQGPQRYNPGGEIALWESKDRGISWSKKKQLTQNSTRNHNYLRRPLLAHPDFYGIWADGHGRQPSESYLYFTNQDWEVFRLPREASEPEIIPMPLAGESVN